MLALHFLIFFIAVTYSAFGSPEEEECKQKKRECNPNRRRLEFPNTVSELEEICSSYPKILACFINFKEECEPEDRLLYIRKQVHENITLACDEDGLAYKVVKENVECMAASIDKGVALCYNNSIQKSNEEKYIIPIVADYFGEFDEMRTVDKLCLIDIHKITCASLVTSLSCGDKVEDVAYEIFDGLSIYIKYCSPEQRELQETLRQAFRGAMNSDEEFVNSIVRKSSDSDN